jgi:hypothetical protein
VVAWVFLTLKPAVIRVVHTDTTLMTLTVRADKQLEQALDALADAEGNSEQEIIHRAVLKRYVLAGHISRVDDAARRMFERWGRCARASGLRVKEVEYLDLGDIPGLVRLLGVGPVRDVGLLDSAIARLRSSSFGEHAYSPVPLKAAALLHSIAHNRALVDGNQRWPGWPRWSSST